MGDGWMGRRKPLIALTVFDPGNNAYHGDFVKPPVSISHNARALLDFENGHFFAFRKAEWERVLRKTADFNNISLDLRFDAGIHGIGFSKENTETVSRKVFDAH